MSQNFQHTEGIILRTIPFRDYDQIITLFTPHVGILKILYKGSRSKRRGAQGLCLPLTQVEVVYREKKGEIFACQEITLMNPFSFLRKELHHLQAACELLQVVLASQLTGKAAPALYALLCFYLEKIPCTLNPWTLTTSFRLKLLRHEGLSTIPFICSACQRLLHTVAYTHKSEAWCLDHRPTESQVWESKELEQIYRLTTCQSYREISKENISLELQKKAARFFDACLRDIL
jgi:DNA repair protein RecO (recombination protein O)